MTRWLLLCASYAIACLNTRAQDLVAKTDPLPPAEEAKKFHLPAGFEAQLVAAEPDIHKPMNIAFDARGRLWLTDTVEYPFPAKAGVKARDTLKILSDFDANGRAKKITTFADNLNIPIGVLPLGNGDSALVFSIPNIWRISAAGQREVVLGKIGQRDTHGLTSAFTLGLDGWVYACHGYANDSTLTARDGSQIKLNSGNVYRFRPDGSHVEFFTHGLVNPFGLCFDPLGNLFASDCETKPISLLLRGAYYPSFGKPDDGLGFAPEICDHMHGSTAVAALVYYAADQFPAEYRDCAFTGNVVTNRINLDSLERRGSGFHAAHRPDFLVSNDPWFRPVALALGPDGALYVADFYNRIIGHYEVPLDHPGRDRTSGRIWRIVYRGDKPAAPPRDFTKETVAQLLADLDDPNLAVRTIATYQLVERGAPATKAVTALLKAKSSPTQRAHALWILERLNALDDKTLAAVAKDPDAFVRVHAFRVMAERTKLTEKQTRLVFDALMDKVATVQRVAADALGTHPDVTNVNPLLDVLAQESDAHLRYATRIALRNQFNVIEMWKARDERDMHAVADICVAVPRAMAAVFLLGRLRLNGEPLENWPRFARHIARYDSDDVSELVKLSRATIPNSLDQQLAIFNAIRQGLEEGGVLMNGTTRGWAEEIITQSLTATDEKKSGWTNSPLPDDPTSANPWAFEKRRCADGTEAVLLSSFPRGETLTGVLRSPAFALPTQLSFYLCGHNGYPNEPDNGQNRIRLRAEGTSKILAEAKPPRNDVAQKITWDLREQAGQRGYLEIIDSDSEEAYAWIAFGRLDPAVVAMPDWNSAAHQRELAAIEMVGALKLTRLEGELTKLLASPDADLSAAAARSLVAFNSDTAREALRAALASAPQRLQLSLALALASNKSGADALLQTITDGKASPRLLQDRALLERLRASDPPRLRQRIASLTKDLPTTDESLQKIFDQRRAGFASAKTDATEGAKIFEKNCAVCHSIGGKGARFAPQLDGVGIRGAERLLEDILDPNRNVDPAFRTTILRLNDGRAMRGLLLREEGDVLVLLDDERQEVRVSKKELQQRDQSPLSPMPANFADAIAEQDLYHLIGFLLTQRAANAK